MSAERFKVQPDEQVLLKGSLTYRKSTWGIVHCQGVLTTKRLVLGKKLNMAWGIVPRLYVWIRGRKIVFETPLENIQSIETGNYFVLKTNDGSEYPLVSDRFLTAKNEDWVRAITDAVNRAGGNVLVKPGTDSVQFDPGSGASVRSGGESALVLTSSAKAWIVAAIGIVFSLGLIVWQVKAGRATPVSLSAEDMATIAADQGAQGRARLSASDSARKDFAKNLRELLAVAEEARLKGFAYKPEIRRQLELTRTVIIAQNYFKTAGSTAAISDADIDAFFKESGQENRFQEFINEMKAQDPTGAQQIPEEQIKQAKHQWGQVMLGERRGIAAGVDKKRNVELQILLQQSRLLAEAYAQENLNPEKNPGMKATDAEIDAYLKAHLEDQVHARHILISAGKAESPDAPSPVPSESDKAQARTKAEQVLKRARAGEDFAALAKQFSSDPGSKDKGGDLGWFAAGQMVPEFDKAAFALQPGQISDIVESQFGFHIIKVEERRMGEKDRNQARETIEQEKGKKWVEDIVKRSHVTVADNYTVTAPAAQPPTSLFAPGGPPEGPPVAPEATDKNPKPAPAPKATNKKR